MAIKLTRKSLDYYILTCLSIQDMYGAQILKNITSYVEITSGSFYGILDTLAKEGKITKKHAVQNGVSVELCRITPSGKKYLDAFLDE